MKKIVPTAITLVALLAFISACDNSLEPEMTLDPHLAVLQLVGQQQRVAFDLLSPVEKALAWQQRLENVYAREFTAAAKSGDDVRRSLFDEFRSLVTDPDNYQTERTEEHVAGLEQGLLEWQQRAADVYDADEIYGLLFTLSADSSLASHAHGKADAERQCTGCCCSVGSMMTCPKMKLSVAGLALEYGECHQSYACPYGSGTSMGCGAGFLFSCNGDLCEF